MGEISVIIGYGPFQEYVAQLMGVAEVGMVGEGGKAGKGAVEGAVAIEVIGREGIGHGEWRDDLRELRVVEQLQVFVLHLQTDVLA